jgi:hypothetical protein
VKSIRAALFWPTAILVTLLSFEGTSRAAQPDRDPIKIKCLSQQQAYIAAREYADSKGASLLLTSGTHSMEPLIHGHVYVVVEKTPYESIFSNDILAYVGCLSASSPQQQAILHRAVERDRYGWMMRGDNNRWTESWDRVTPKNYMGRAVALFTFPQA